MNFDAVAQPSIFFDTEKDLKRKRDNSPSKANRSLKKQRINEDKIELVQRVQAVFERTDARVGVIETRTQNLAARAKQLTENYAYTIALGAGVTLVTIVGFGVFAVPPLYAVFASTTAAASTFAAAPATLTSATALATAVPILSFIK